MKVNISDNNVKNTASNALNDQKRLFSGLLRKIIASAQSLRVHLAVIVTMVSFLAAVSFALLTTFYTNQQLSLQHQANVDRQLSNYSQIAARSMASFDYVSINDLIDYMVQSPEIDAIRVKNSYDQMVGFSSVNEPDLYTERTPDRVLIMQAPDQSNSAVGEMTLWLNPQPVSADIQSLSGPLVVILFTFLLLITVLIYRYIAFSIVRPLKKVETNIVNFDHSEVVDNSWFISSEIKRLQTRYVRMNARVQNQMRDLSSLAERRHHFFSHSPALLLLTNATGDIELASEQFLSFIGCSIEEIRGRSLKSFLIVDYLDDWQEIVEKQQQKATINDVTLELHTNARGVRRITYSSTLEVNTEQYLAYLNDITVEHKNRERLRQIARTDELTDLPNRAETERFIQDLIYQYTPLKKNFALFFIDLDNFKRINDVYGHSIGDQALINLSRSMQEILPNYCHIGRFGGDEFVVVLPKIDEIDTIISQLYERLKSPFAYNNQTFYLSTSIGVARWPEDGATTELILRNADLALYQAKRSGRNRVINYVKNFEEEANRWIEAGDMIRKALLDSSFTYHWQEIYNRDNEVVFYELLLRLHGENDKIIYPGDFIDIAEEAGLMGNIAEFTAAFVETLIKQSTLDGSKITINLSRSQLLLKGLDEIIKPLIPYHQNIIFEVTEDAFLGGNDTLVALRRLNAYGFKLALDDFGTGYSSLSLLTEIPVDIVKLDKKLLDSVSIHAKSQDLYESIVRMVHSLGKTVVAEGIETVAHHHFAYATGCDYLQGYYYNYPSPVQQPQSAVSSARKLREQQAVLYKP